jgi:hypothetical protein
LTDGEELAVRGTLFAARLTGLLVGIGIEVVVVDVLRGVFTMSGVGNSIKATIGNPIPAGLGLIGEEDVGTVLPSEPSVHLL